MDRILDLQISYPDFQLNQIIDPDQVDLNNTQIVNKVNVLINAINALSQGSSGAGNITIAPLPDHPSAKTVQQALESIARYAKDNRTTINQILAKNTEQDNRLGAIDTKNNQQDSRLTTAEGNITSQGTRLTSNELKDTQQDKRIADLEVKDDLDESWIRGIDAKVDSNTGEIVTIKKEIDEIRDVNANAELVEARTSDVYDKTYHRLKDRLNDGEIVIATDVPTSKRSQMNFMVVDENVPEVWSDSVRLGDINVHKQDNTAHANLITNHELDATSHTDIRGKITALPQYRGVINKFSDALEDGNYRVYLCTDASFPEEFGMLSISKKTNPTESAFFISSPNSTVYSNVFANGAWKGWKQLATTNKIDNLSTYMRNSWTCTAETKCVNSGETITFTGQFNKNGGSTSDWTNLATDIPPQFRPRTSQVRVIMPVYDFAGFACNLLFYHSGEIQIEKARSGLTVVDFSLTFARG